MLHDHVLVSVSCVVVYVLPDFFLDLCGTGEIRRRLCGYGPSCLTVSSIHILHILIVHNLSIQYCHSFSPHCNFTIIMSVYSVQTKSISALFFPLKVSFGEYFLIGINGPSMEGLVGCMEVLRGKFMILS